MEAGILSKNVAKEPKPQDRRKLPGPRKGGLDAPEKAQWSVSNSTTDVEPAKSYVKDIPEESSKKLHSPDGKSPRKQDASVSRQSHDEEGDHSKRYSDSRTGKETSKNFMNGEERLPKPKRPHNPSPNGHKFPKPNNSSPIDVEALHERNNHGLRDRPLTSPTPSRDQDTSETYNDQTRSSSKGGAC